jgi:predicted NUDIX family phosphoesterase
MSKNINIVAVPIVKIEEKLLGTIATPINSVEEISKFLEYAEFSLRSTLETDFAWKQVIPYVVVRDVATGDILTYTRSTNSGEDRLHNKKSVGIGGHIDETEDTQEYSNYDLVINSMIREVQEELGLSTTPDNYKLLGIINDDSDEVGKVHIGIVYELLIGAKKFKLDGGEQDVLVERSWESIKSLKVLDNLENWSILALGLVANDSSNDQEDVDSLL